MHPSAGGAACKLAELDTSAGAKCVLLHMAHDLLLAIAANRHIGQVHVASGRVLVSAKHGRDGFGQLRMVRLVDTACVNPIVFQPILPRSVSAEPQFSISILVLSYLLLNIVKGDFVLIGSPGIGEDGVGEGRCSHVLGQHQLTLGTSGGGQWAVCRV